MSVRRWWDEQPNEASYSAPVSADLQNTVKDSVTMIEALITSRVFIKPAFRVSVMGFSDCILKIYRKTFHIDITFDSVAGELVMSGCKESVSRCREEVENTLAILHW